MNPLLLIAGAAAAAAAVVYLYQRREADGPGMLTPPPYGVIDNPGGLPYGDGLPGPGQGATDPMSAGLAAHVDKLERSKIASPQYVAKIAKAFKKKGKFATGVRLAQSARRRVEVLGGFTHKIRSGDNPAAMAQAMTGSANRWPELIGTPSSLGPLATYKDANGWDQMSPWRVGQIVILPKGWTPVDFAPPSGSAEWNEEPAAGWPSPDEMGMTEEDALAATDALQWDPSKDLVKL